MPLDLFNVRESTYLAVKKQSDRDLDSVKYADEQVEGPSPDTARHFYRIFLDAVTTLF